MATIVTLKKMSMEKLTARAVALSFVPSASDTKDQIANFIIQAETAATDAPAIVPGAPVEKTAKAPKAEHIYNCKDMKMVRGNVRAMTAEILELQPSTVLRRTLSANSQEIAFCMVQRDGGLHYFVNGEMTGNDKETTYAWLAIRLGFKAAPIEAVEVDDEAGAAYEASINAEYNDEAVSV